jgi:hypothetical protein
LFLVAACTAGDAVAAGYAAGSRGGVAPGARYRGTARVFATLGTAVARGRAPPPPRLHRHPAHASPCRHPTRPAQLPVLWRGGAVLPGAEEYKRRAAAG